MAFWTLVAKETLSLTFTSQRAETLLTGRRFWANNSYRRRNLGDNLASLRGDDVYLFYTEVRPLGLPFLTILVNAHQIPTPRRLSGSSLRLETWFVDTVLESNIR